MICIIMDYWKHGIDKELIKTEAKRQNFSLYAILFEEKQWVASKLMKSHRKYETCI